MDKLEKIMGEYQKALTERQAVWNRNYSTEVCEALHHETEIIACELENLIKAGQRESEPAKQVEVKNYYKKRQLDEAKIAGLKDEEKAVLRFVAESKVPNALGYKYFEVYNTALYQDLRKFLFEYWKNNNPERIKEIVSKSYEKLSYKGKWYAPQKRHFARLIKKDPSKIKFEDLENKKFIDSCSFTSPLRNSVNLYIRGLIAKGVLAHGVTKSKASVHFKFLK